MIGHRLLTYSEVYTQVLGTLWHAHTSSPPVNPLFRSRDFPLFVTFPSSFFFWKGVSITSEGTPNLFFFYTYPGGPPTYTYNSRTVLGYTTTVNNWEIDTPFHFVKTMVVETFNVDVSNVDREITQDFVVSLLIVLVGDLVRVLGR